MEFKAKQIAAIIDGEIEGNPRAIISNIAKIEEAHKGDLVFVANPKYEHFLAETKAEVALVSNYLEKPSAFQGTLIRVADPYQAFAKLMKTYEKLTEPPTKSGRENPSFVAKSARIGRKVYIGALSYIGENVTLADSVQIYPGSYIGDNVQIGENSVIHANVSIYTNGKIGQNVIVHAGAVIGSDGFGFAPQGDGSFKKVPQLGHVVLEDNVEVGANTTIDRATMGATKIKENAKLDNLIQIAHNVVIGENTAIAAQAGVSGSTKVGRGCIVGGQAGIVGHLELAEGTRINAQSGVTKSVKKNNVDLNGSPAFAYKEALRSQVVFRKLPQLLERINDLEKKIKALQNDNFK